MHPKNRSTTRCFGAPMLREYQVTKRYGTKGGPEALVTFTVTARSEQDAHDQALAFDMSPRYLGGLIESIEFVGGVEYELDWTPSSETA